MGIEKHSVRVLVGRTGARWDSYAHARFLCVLGLAAVCQLVFLFPHSVRVGQCSDRARCCCNNNEITASVKIYPRAILSTPGTSGYYISYKRVLRAVLQKPLRWGIFMRRSRCVLADPSVPSRHSPSQVKMTRKFTQLRCELNSEQGGGSGGGGAGGGGGQPRQHGGRGSESESESGSESESESGGESSGGGGGGGGEYESFGGDGDEYQSL